MNILEKLTNYYYQAGLTGYTPSSIGVSNEEYEEYEALLEGKAVEWGLVFIDKPSKLSYRGIKLKKYGKQHTDEKRKKTPKND